MLNMEYQLTLNWPDFLERHWQKRPVVLKRGFNNFIDPISPDELAGLAMESEVDSRLVSHQDGKWQVSHGRDNQLHHPFQTSWGVSTRLVGAIIMTHGDDDGLILPPAVAPIQVVVVPIAAHKPGVSEKAAELAEKISKYARVKLDDSDNAPGWKFSQWEMKGVPLRLEIGPKDLEKNQCVLVRRDTREKVFVSLDELETAIPAQLEALRKDLYERALANREKRTWAATTMDEVKELAKANTGYIKTMWCGDLACEMKMKEEVGLSSRCMPFEQEHLSDVCPCCGKPAKTMVYWGVAY